ncbi:MAG: hypothetical protein KDH94_08595, partial [Coxiellaceae bacterium]|nr:hypothetical protein [Coxiellaceae bacterium]
MSRNIPVIPALLSNSLNYYAQEQKRRDWLVCADPKPPVGNNNDLLALLNTKNERGEPLPVSLEELLEFASEHGLKYKGRDYSKEQFEAFKRARNYLGFVDFLKNQMALPEAEFNKIKSDSKLAQFLKDVAREGLWFNGVYHKPDDFHQFKHE